MPSQSRQETATRFDVTIDLPLQQGVLVRRYKRFLADVTLEDGSALTVHCPNSGSMLGMKEPGSPVVVSDSQNDARKLRHTLEFVQVDDGGGPTWIGVNTARPNGLVEHALRAGLLPDIAQDTPLRREVRYAGNSRIDLLASPEDGGAVWIEVKNTTLSATHTDGVLEARFPDAVTARGQKHMEALAERVAAGDRAMVVFLVNRSDAERFAVASDIDPRYAEVLDQARQAGVETVPLSVRNHVARTNGSVSVRTVLGPLLPARWS